MDTQERKILYYLFLAALILGAFLLVFFRNLLRHYRYNQRLYKQLTSVEMATLERERKRIVADLHDGMGPLLSATKLLISSIPVSGTEKAAIAKKAMENTDRLLEKVRQVSFDLMPGILSKKGLIAAIQEHVRQLEMCTETRWVVTYNDGLEVEENTAVHLYRIIGEAMNNTLKYAGAKQCTVDLKREGTALLVQICDDGKGFRQDRCRGSGLNNIALRTEMLNGKFFLESSPGSGTTIEIRIPVCKFIN